MATAIAFVRRDFLASASYRFSFAMHFVSILFSVGMFYYIAEVFGFAAAPMLQSYGGDYFAFVLIGLAFSDYMAQSISTFSSSIREGQTMGTLEVMLLSPVRLSSILISSSIWGYVMTSVRVVIYLLLGTFVFGVSMEHANPLTALVIFFLSIASYCGLGIISACFIIVFKKGDPIAWAFGGFSALLSGVFYPIGVLPEWIRPISSLVPLTYSLDGMRLALLQGYSILAVWQDVAVLAAFSVVLLPASIFGFRLAVRQAKKEGSLAQY